MTNSYTDIRNTKTLIFLGGNPAEAHPVSLQHLLEGKELNRANFIVADPRLTRTAAHATEYVRLRPGTDIPVLWGMLWHIFQNGWEDKEFIEQRVYGMDDIRKEVEKWTPEEVERVSGVPGAQLKRVAEMFAKDKPACLIWAMGQTQHTVGTANVRASCILLLATGNVGKPGAGANIFRGHTNVQGATDLGLDIVTLPLYYGLVEGAWKHWCRVWEVDYDWMVSRFADKKMMETPGIPSTRWFDATLLPKDQVGQDDNLKAMIVMGHGGNTVTRMPEAAKGIEKLDLLVVADPHPTTWAVLAERKNGTYLLPIATSYETNGSRTASNRAIQWGEQIVKPIFESKDDNEVMYLLAKKLGFADKMFKNIKVENNLPSPEDVLREINRGGWSTGYCGQSPERLKLHMANQKDFDMRTQKAMSGPAQGRLLRSALAMLGYSRVQASGNAAAVQHQRSRSRTAAAPSAPASASSARRSCPMARPARSACSAMAITPRIPRSRTAIPSSAMGCSRSSAGTRISDPKSLRSSRKSAATTRTACPGRSISRAASSVSRSSTAASPTATARRAPTPGTCPTRSRYTASRSTRRGPSSSPSIRPCPTPSSTACPISASRCRRRRWTRALPSSFRSSSPPAGWSNTKAAARKPAPTSGSPSCSRTCSSRSIRPMPPSAASRTAAGSG